MKSFLLAVEVSLSTFEAELTLNLPNRSKPLARHFLSKILIRVISLPVSFLYKFTPMRCWNFSKGNKYRLNFSGKNKSASIVGSSSVKKLSQLPVNLDRDPPSRIEPRQFEFLAVKSALRVCSSPTTYGRNSDRRGSTAVNRIRLRKTRLTDHPLKLNGDQLSSCVIRNR